MSLTQWDARMAQQYELWFEFKMIMLWLGGMILFMSALLIGILVWGPGR